MGIVHSSKGQVTGKLFCDGEVTKNAATCDTDLGTWSYQEDLSCCSVRAQLSVKDGMWERYSYNRYRLFCSGVAQDVIYICEGGMWVAYPQMEWNSIYYYCQSEVAMERSTSINFKELSSER